MKELDAVKLVEDYENIKAGTEGVIVHEYDGRAFEVEFFDDEDNTIDVVTTPTKWGGDLRKHCSKDGLA